MSSTGYGRKGLHRVYGHRPIGPYRNRLTKDPDLVKERYFHKLRYTIFFIATLLFGLSMGYLMGLPNPNELIIKEIVKESIRNKRFDTEMVDSNVCESFVMIKNHGYIECTGQKEIHDDHNLFICNCKVIEMVTRW